VLGYAFCGSFCTFGKSLEALRRLVSEGHEIQPIISERAYSTDTRFFLAADFAGQVDIGPTLLSLLGISYVQNNFGINLVQEKRPCIFYSADNTVAARDSSHLYVYNPDADREFCYNTTSGTPQAEEMNAQYAALKHYCFTMLQATEQLVQQQLTTDKILNK
jgi:hypothetical protein